jgi:protein-disulfide isomerase
MNRSMTMAALCVSVALSAGCGGSDLSTRSALATPAAHASFTFPDASGPEGQPANADAAAAPVGEPTHADVNVDPTEVEAGTSNVRFQVPIGKSPARGPATALVTIVEFADYQCPFCARVEDTLRSLRARYGDDLRIVFKDAPLPFHPQADPAAQAALEVRAEKGDAAFWAMHDALFVHQRELDAAVIVRLAEAAGARPEKVRAAISSHAHAPEIQGDQDIADDFDADGTPYFFIDGRPLVGAQPESEFVAVIDEEVKAAKGLRAGGTAAAALYDALIKDGQKPEEPERKDVPPLPAGDPARGPATAKVAIHEFADFQCPFCIRAEPTVREVQSTYGPRVRFVWHDFPLPFHADARPAARAAREAKAQGGDRAFWQLHDRLLSEHAGLSRADLDDYARVSGLNMVQWSAALGAAGHEAEIDADIHAAEALGIDGTPTFLVVPSGSRSGYLIVGAQPFAKFHKIIERALGEAR